MIGLWSSDRMRAGIPNTITVAAMLVLASHSFGLWQMVRFSRTLGLSLWMPYSALAFIYSLLGVVLVSILLGKNWARICYAMISAFGLMSVIGHVAELTILAWVVVSLKVAAVVLLYVPKSEHWFDRAKFMEDEKT